MNRFDAPTRKSPGRQLIKVPGFALPTAALALATFGAWCWVSWQTFFNEFYWVYACILNTLLAYISFTPQHDAVHGSISSKYKWLNDGIGRMSGVPLFSPFYAFQRLHLSHHRHTNDPDNDPDFWSGKGPWFVLPFRWLTQELYYWYISATKLKETSKERKREVILTLLLFYGLSVGLAVNGYSSAVIWAWIVPSRLASGLLAFLFDYLPHQPHRIPMRKDPFKATRNIEGPGLSLFFLSQNYHLVHHTFPTVPFYRYLRLWRRHRPWFEERGGQTVKPMNALRKNKSSV
jgi:fatty acid desaturase